MNGEVNRASDACCKVPAFQGPSDHRSSRPSHELGRASGRSRVPQQGTMQSTSPTLGKNRALPVFRHRLEVDGDSEGSAAVDVPCKGAHDLRPRGAPYWKSGVRTTAWLARTKFASAAHAQRQDLKMSCCVSFPTPTCSSCGKTTWNV